MKEIELRVAEIAACIYKDMNAKHLTVKSDQCMEVNNQPMKPHDKKN